MTDRDLERELRAWYRSEPEADVAPPELRRRVLAVPHSIPARRGASGKRRGLTLLVAATLLIGGAVAAGTGILRLQLDRRDPTPAPSEAIRRSPSPIPPAPTDVPQPPSVAIAPAPLTQQAMNTVQTFLLATPETGWVGTDGPIYRTGDTGQTWRDVSPAGWSATSATALVDGSTAYLASDSVPMTIAVTHDGGSTWTSATINPESASGGGPWFAFQTPDRGFATFFDRADSTRLRVYATTDGGRSWTGPREGRIPQIPQSLGKLEGPSGGVYYLVSGKADNKPFNNGIELSMDGGVTWKARSFPIGPAAPKAVQKSIARIWPEGDGVIRMAIAADDRGSVWFSRDDARTWQLIRAMPKDVPFGDAVFVTPTTWLTLPNGSDQVRSTDDAGAHWQTTTVAAGTSPLPWDVSFASSRVGWGVQHCTFGHVTPGCEGAAGESFLMTTVDGGGTWSRLVATVPVRVPPKAATGPEAWIDTGSMGGPQGPDLPAMRLDDGRVLVVGGSTGAGAVSYDPDSGRWTRAASPAHVRDGAILARVGDSRAILAGGSYGSKDRKTTELFDPRTGRWTPGPSMQRARANFQAATLQDGRVLVVGGEAGRPVSAEIYDPATRRWTMTGRPRDVAAGTSQLVVLGDGRVFVCCGYTESVDSPTATAELFDPVTGRWSATVNMPQPRSGAGAILLRDGRVLVVGGAKSFAGRELPTNVIFDPATGTWTEAAPTATPRTDRSLALLPNGRVLVAGGGDPAAGILGARFEADVYDPVADTWSPTAGMHTNRWGAAAIVLQDGSVLLVGGHTTGAFQFVGTAERYYPNGAPSP